MTISNPVGFWKRFLANILDAIIIGVPLAIINNIINGDTQGETFTSIIEILYSIIVPVLWSGYTIGKRIAGIRIVKVNGEKLGYGAMLLRALVGGLVYIVTLGIGLIVSAFMVGLRKDKRAIHDFIAGTYVTSDQPGETPSH